MTRDEVVEEAAADEREEKSGFAPREEEQAFDKKDAVPPPPRRGENRAEGQRQKQIDECQRAEKHLALAENAL
jgi:hypothetical protein